jgi:hypothetical protein
VKLRLSGVARRYCSAGPARAKGRFPVPASVHSFSKRRGRLAALGMVVGLGLSIATLRAHSADPPKEFTVGNRFISRVFQIDENQAFTGAFKAKSQIAVSSTEFEIICHTGGREVVFNRYTASAHGFTVSPSGEEAVLSWATEAPAMEIKVHYQTTGGQSYLFKWLEISNRSSETVHVQRATVDALEVAQNWSNEPRRGGPGQPVILNNEFFLGIEHPAGANEVRGGGIALAHYPDNDVAPGATWLSKRAVLGAAAAGESVEDAFRKYLLYLTGRPAKFEAIYNDWGAHDELGTLVKPQLTAQLTGGLLDQLERMKSEEGTQFDHYVLDAFWYDPCGVYLTFRQPNWPKGYEPALRRMQALGMKPGLWFDLGGSTLDLKNTPGWNGSEKPCLADGDFRALLEKAITFHTRDHSLSLLKFDFANMFCRPEGTAEATLAALERNADGLGEVCDAARKANPSMKILGFNVFSLVEMMSSTKRYDEAYPVSPWWLRWFDAVYSGDPRPSELPSVTSLRDSLDTYQDHVFRGFVRSLMPPFNIDDSGTIIGKTSTTYYLGAEGFTDSWILNVMRGAHSPTLYGDVRLLSKNDRGFLTATLRFLHDYALVLSRTQPVLGIPGRGEVYGYLSHDKKLALVTVVNPGLYPQDFTVPLPKSDPSRALSKLVFSNDAQAKQTVTPAAGVIQGELIPGEIRVYAAGPRESIAAISLPLAPTRQYHKVTPVVDPFEGKKDGELPIVPAQAGKTLAIILQYFKDGEPDRSFDRPQEVIKVTGTIASMPLAFTSNPAAHTDIWSKCSWAVFKHKIASRETGRTLRLKLAGDPPPGTMWRVTALWLQ